MVKNIILNADDLGFSRGVNEAILQANTKGSLTLASLMVNKEYFDHAVKEIIPSCNDHKIGVYVNLTCAKALFSQNALAENGALKNDFVKLLFRRKTAKVLDSLEKEIELQILKIKNSGIEISHIGGHENIHIIPSISKIVRKLAKKYNVNRVREINEDLSESCKFNGKTLSFADMIKLLVLKFLSIFNENSGKVGFYSMIDTCEINGTNLFRFSKKSNTYETVEVMLRPALSTLDSEDYYQTLAARFISLFQNSDRKSEFNLCFGERFKDFKIL